MKHLLIYTLLFTTSFASSIVAQQEYKDAAGFYNLSGFEQSSGFYLLKNKTFFFFLTVGSADLKVYGNYTISNQKLQLEIDKSLTKQLFVYGYKNIIKHKEITAYYYKPYRQEKEQIIVLVGNKKIKFPEFTDKDFVATTINLRKNRKIEILNNNTEEINILEADLKHQTIKEKSTKIKVPDNVDEIVILSNYYFKMITQFLQMNFTLKNGELTTDNNFKNKTISKKEITKITNDKVLYTIQKLKNSNLTIVKGDKTFYKL